MMELHLDKPMVNWKYHTLKMHVMQSAYEISWFSLAYLKCAHNTSMSLVVVVAKSCLTLQDLAYISLQMGKII